MKQRQKQTKFCCRVHFSAFNFKVLHYEFEIRKLVSDASQNTETEMRFLWGREDVKVKSTETEPSDSVVQEYDFDKGSENTESLLNVFNNFNSTQEHSMFVGVDTTTTKTENESITQGEKQSEVVHFSPEVHASETKSDTSFSQNVIGQEEIPEIDVPAIKMPTQMSSKDAEEKSNMNDMDLLRRKCTLVIPIDENQAKLLVLENGCYTTEVIKYSQWTNTLSYSCDKGFDRLTYLAVMLYQISLCLNKKTVFLCEEMRTAFRNTLKAIGEEVLEIQETYRKKNT